jgi:hypothetical protein
VLSCQGRLVDTAKGFAATLYDVFHLDPKLEVDQGLAAWDHVEQDNGNFKTDGSRSAWERAVLSHSVSATMTMQSQSKFLKFGVADGGRFMRAPHASQSGDWICVLVGGEMPFIIRSTGRGTYELVGECYVDGIMDREALKMGSDATAQYETICSE